VVQLARSDIFEILATRDYSSRIWQKYSDSLGFTNASFGKRIDFIMKPT